jgi:hypothetical protein
MSASPSKAGHVGGGRYPDLRLGILSAPSHSLDRWEQWPRADFPLQGAMWYGFCPLKTLPFNKQTTSAVKISAHSCGAVMELHHFPFHHEKDRAGKNIYIHNISYMQSKLDAKYY